MTNNMVPEVYDESIEQRGTKEGLGQEVAILSRSEQRRRAHCLHDATPRSLIAHEYLPYSAALSHNSHRVEGKGLQCDYTFRASHNICS